MPDIIRLNQEDNIIEIRSFDTVSENDIETSINKIIQIFEETGINAVLVDTIGQKDLPGTVGIYSIFSEFPRGFKVALLADQRQRTTRDLYFAVTEAKNRGFMLLIFYTRDKALEWLKK
ncbi:hypothetical protein ACFLZW_00805 [Chloroflexota bacterium]